MLRWILTAILLFTGATHATAVEIVGQIGAVEEKGVAVLVVGNVVPQVGDKFVVVIDVPGVGEARIAQGQVNALDSGIALRRFGGRRRHEGSGRRASPTVSKQYRSASLDGRNRDPR